MNSFEEEKDWLSHDGKNIIIDGFDKDGNPDKVIMIFKAKDREGEFSLIRFSGHPTEGKIDRVSHLQFIAEGLDYLITNDQEYVIEAAKTALNEQVAANEASKEVPVEEKDKEDK